MNLHNLTLSVVYSKAYARYVRMHGLPPLLDPIHNILPPPREARPGRQTPAHGSASLGPL